MGQTTAARWVAPDAYERFMGRWSRMLAPLLVEFADLRDGDRVLDVGCGTGNLTEAVLASGKAAEVVAIDASEAFVGYARQRFAGQRARIEVADARQLPFADGEFDRCVSQLALNFVPEPIEAANEMRRVVKAGGKAAAAVWDYRDGMEMLRIFWDGAQSLDPDVRRLHESGMPLGRPGELSDLWREAGFESVDETALTLPTEFANIADYWDPFLAGVGPAGAYARDLPEDRRQALRSYLCQYLANGREDAPFTLSARAWAVLGTAGA